MPSNHSDITLNSGHANAAVIRQITSLNYSENPNVKPIMGSGGITPKTHIVEGGEPQIAITTTDTSLLELGTRTWLQKGYCATDAASIIPNNVFEDCAVLNAGGVHTGVSSPKVLMVPTTISATGSEALQINADLRLFGTNRRAFPLTALTSQALKVESFAEEHELAKIFLKGVELTEVTGFTLNLGLNVVRDKLGGFPTSFTIQGVASTLEIQVENIAKAQAEIAANSTLAGGGCIIYLAKRVSEGQIVAADSTTNSKITALDGLVQTQSISFSEGSNGSGTIKMSIGNSNNANGGALLTYAVDVDIP